MASHKTTGIVIDRRDFSETSQVVCFYTREYGQVRVLAKGAKRPKSPFEGPLDLLAGGSLLFLERRPEHLGILTAFHRTDRFDGVRRDLGRFHRSLWVCELLARLTRERDVNEELFRLVWEWLERIAADGGGRLGQLAFESRCVRLLGFAPRADRCVACERAAEGAAEAWFGASAGGMLCGACRGSDRDAIRVSAGTLALLDNLAWGRTTDVERIRANDAALRELRAVLSAWVTRLVGREPRILRYLEVHA